MSETGLSERQLAAIRQTLGRFPVVEAAILYGSRAKGTHRDESDIDLALLGPLDDLQAEAVAAALDELPMPQRFDVKAHDRVKSPALRAHIRRVGTVIYRRGQAS